jgi:hypothetical protein
MSGDPNKKSARTFQCRDVLWETFEQMAQELECSVDYLVNEAMKQYARQRSYGGVRTPQPPPPGRGAAEQSGQHAGVPPVAAPPPRTLSRAATMPARPGSSLPLPPPRAGLPAPPPAARRAPSQAALAAPPVAAAARSMPAVPHQHTPPGRSIPPPLPRASRAALMGGGSSTNGAVGSAPGSTLTLVYNGERYPITKDRFVIGRGKQSSDLTLKDPNVSRQHALIEFHNGVYFMVDMGSTNGVAFNGQRIARRQIAEGDVFRICDHDLQFTYR